VTNRLRSVGDLIQAKQSTIFAFSRNLENGAHVYEFRSSKSLASFAYLAVLTMIACAPIHNSARRRR
jgi:hypothetical protein